MCEHCAIKFCVSYKGWYIFEGQGANELNLNMPQKQNDPEEGRIVTTSLRRKNLFCPMKPARTRKTTNLAVACLETQPTHFYA